jgi:hypothetical protein
MYNGPPIGFPFSFIVDVCNSTWSTNCSNIFVDYCCNDKLFIDSCFIIKNVSQFHVVSS